MRTSIKRTRKIKNNILAIEAAPAAMPVKPKIAAIIAIMKNIAAHLSISQSLKGEQLKGMLKQLWRKCNSKSKYNFATFVNLDNKVF